MDFRSCDQHGVVDVLDEARQTVAPSDVPNRFQQLHDPFFRHRNLRR
jgi:hypothetical protein